MVGWLPAIYAKYIAVLSLLWRQNWSTIFLRVLEMIGEKSKKKIIKMVKLTDGRVSFVVWLFVLIVPQLQQIIMIDYRIEWYRIKWIVQDFWMCDWLFIYYSDIWRNTRTHTQVFTHNYISKQKDLNTKI